MKAAVMSMMAIILTQAMIFIALVDFFALKYRHAKRKCKLFNSLKDEGGYSLLGGLSSVDSLLFIFLNNSSILKT